jgi:CRP/FNR family transcriptional regulator
MTDTTGILEQWFPQDDVVLRQLGRQVQRVHLPAGQAVFHRGDACQNYLVVVKGSVRVQTLSAGGREVVLYRVTDGQSCVITTSCLISEEAYPAEGITDEETEALVIPQHVFNQALGHSETFRRFVFANQGKRLADLIQRVEDVAFGRVDARLAKHLVDRCGNQPGSVSATHQQLASELGTAREVVSRQLKAFERAGLVAVHRGAVEVLKPDALIRVWGEVH